LPWDGIYSRRSKVHRNTTSTKPIVYWSQTSKYINAFECWCKVEFCRSRNWNQINFVCQLRTCLYRMKDHLKFYRNYNQILVNIIYIPCIPYIYNIIYIYYIYTISTASETSNSTADGAVWLKEDIKSIHCGEIVHIIWWYCNWSNWDQVLIWCSNYRWSFRAWRDCIVSPKTPLWFASAPVDLVIILWFLL